MLNVTQKKGVNVVGWTTSPHHHPLGFLNISWYLQLLRFKQSGKEERLVEGSCIFRPYFYKDTGKIKALTNEGIICRLVLDAGLQL